MAGHKACIEFKVVIELQLDFEEGIAGSLAFHCKINVQNLFQPKLGKWKSTFDAMHVKATMS